MSQQSLQSSVSPLSSLEPALVWQYFYELSQIPRPSGKEQKVMDWIMQIAKQHNLIYKTDSAGNLCLHVPATKGYENAPTVILQSHADMVTEKTADSTFNFDTDPLQIYVADGWIRARETTLGADNGIGLCLSLAAATDPSYEHPALEILVTVEEETTFKGALNLDPKALGMKGTILLNLDNEEQGAVFISSAGMLRMSAKMPLEREPELDPAKSYLQISLENLPGGHSGCQIQETERENAILALIAILNQIPHRLISFNGGDKDNAIPRNAMAVIQVEPEQVLILQNQDLKSEAGYQFQVELLGFDQVILPPIQYNFVSGLKNFLNGVISLHHSIPNLVQTSSNLASIHTSDNQVDLRISIRSCLNQDLFEIANLHTAWLESMGFSCHRDRITPGWNGDPNSNLLLTALAAYKDLTGSDAEVKAIHAGLEVGELTNKLQSYLNSNANLASDSANQKVQAISFGPTIVDAHSPDERVNIQSTEFTYKYLKDLLRRILA